MQKTLNRTENPFLEGFLSVFFIPYNTTEYEQAYPIQSQEYDVEKFYSIKHEYKDFLTYEKKTESLLCHSVLLLKIRSVYECLDVDVEDFNLSSLSLRLISLKVVFERESEKLFSSTKYKIKMLISQTEEYEQFMESSFIPKEIRENVLRKAPQARGSASIYDETRAYMLDEMRQNSLSKVLSP